MKSLILLLTIALSACTVFDNRAKIGKEYVKEHLKENGFFGNVLEVKKTNGTEYVNQYDGTEMYAMDFAATCQTSDEGFLLIVQDDYVTALKPYSNDPALEKNFASYGVKRSIAVHPGSQFKYASKVIM